LGELLLQARDSLLELVHLGSKLVFEFLLQLHIFNRLHSLGLIRNLPVHQISPNFLQQFNFAFSILNFGFQLLYHIPLLVVLQQVILSLLKQELSLVQKFGPLDPQLLSCALMFLQV
jgi:hypothetical protein